MAAMLPWSFSTNMSPFGPQIQSNEGALTESGGANDRPPRLANLHVGASSPCATWFDEACLCLLYIDF